MLIDKEMFDKVEEFLCKKGKTVKFESEYGEIKGRMMITKADIPDGIDVRLIPGKTPQAFEASFESGLLNKGMVQRHLIMSGLSFL